MRLIRYIKECTDELMHKVNWPTWSELQSSAIVVLVASLIIALIVFGMDTVFKWTMEEVVYKILFQ